MFADYGVEAEALASLGKVHRFTINPIPNEFVAETATMDLMDETPSGTFDLAVLHPRCSKWTDMPGVDPDDHPNQIPRAREIAEQIAADYIIENKPRAPLNDAVTLHGRMFGLPLAYERAFETSFDVPRPPMQQTFGGKTVTPYFYSDRTRSWWASAKGYVGDYPKQHLAKNALPAAYVQFLTRSWLESLDTRDAEVPKDNNDPAPTDQHPSQERLVQSDGGRNSRSVDTERSREDGGDR
jgi:hypothetical protein